MKIFVLHRNLVTTTKEIVILTPIAMDPIQFVFIMVAPRILDSHLARIAVVIYAQKILIKLDNQDFALLTVHVKLMKAIANLMTNVYLVLFVDMTTANPNLAIQMKQIVASTKLNIAPKS